MADDKKTPQQDTRTQAEKVREAWKKHDEFQKKWDEVSYSGTPLPYPKSKDADKVKFTHDDHYDLKKTNDKIKEQGVFSVSADELESATRGSYKLTARGKNTISPDDFVNSRDELRQKNPAQNPGDHALKKAQDQAFTLRHTYTDEKGNRVMDIKEMAMEGKVGHLSKQHKALKENPKSEPDDIKHAKSELDKAAGQWHARRQELGLEKPPVAKAVEHKDDKSLAVQKPNIDKQHRSDVAKHDTSKPTQTR